MTGHGDVPGHGGLLARDGWGALLLATAARTYLVLVLSLAAIAVLPLLFGWHGTVVQSGSMEPGISAGDVVLATPLPDTSPVPVGGVVEYASPAAAEPSGVAKTRLHRIVSADDDGTFVTAGDANRNVDSTPITREQITGQARLLVQFVGLPGLWLSTGRHVPLVVWVVLTVGALVVTARVGTPTETRSSRPGMNPRSGPRRGGVRTPALLILVGATAVTGLTALPHPESSAAFSGRTSTGSGTWTVARLPELGPGLATPYAALAATTIINAGPPGQVDVDGSLGTSPGRTINGFNHVSGTTERGTAAALGAMAGATALHQAASARTATGVVGPRLTGVVGPGVYDSVDRDLTVSGNLTLDARGDPSAIFVFRTDSLTATANSTMTLVNGATARNVYWLAAGSVTLDTGTTSAGNYLAAGDLTMRPGSTLEGRLISLRGSVTVDRSTVRLPR